jgi:hypothetical protein
MKGKIPKLNETILNNMDKNKSQASVSKYKHDVNGQIKNIPVIVNGLVTPNNNKVLNSDIIHSYDNDKTVETNVKRKKETPNEKDTYAAANNSKNKGNHTILIIGDSHARDMQVN